MAKTDARVCGGNTSCVPFPDRLEDARQSCTPKKRCKVGGIVRKGGREIHGVWLEVATGWSGLSGRRMLELLTLTWGTGGGG
jgi:hypothetical protein